MFKGGQDVEIFPKSRVEEITKVVDKSSFAEKAGAEEDERVGKTVRRVKVSDSVITKYDLSSGSLGNLLEDNQGDVKWRRARRVGSRVRATREVIELQVAFRLSAKADRDNLLNRSW